MNLELRSQSWRQLLHKHLRYSKSLLFEDKIVSGASVTMRMLQRHFCTLLSTETIDQFLPISHEIYQCLKNLLQILCNMFIILENFAFDEYLRGEYSLQLQIFSQDLFTRNSAKMSCPIWQISLQSKFNLEEFNFILAIFSFSTSFRMYLKCSSNVCPTLMKSSN